MPEKVTRMVELIRRRSSVRVVTEKNRKVLAGKWAPGCSTCSTGPTRTYTEPLSCRKKKSDST